MITKICMVFFFGLFAISGIVTIHSLQTLLAIAAALTALALIIER